MQEYKRGFQRVHALAERISTTQVDELIKAHLAQHLCVIVSGIIENACSYTLSTYAENTASPATAGYAKRKLAQFNNADPKKIEELVGAFSKDWKEKLCSFWSGEIRDSVGSIVSNRHNISHGRQVAVSLAQILKWTENAEKFCEKLENIIIPIR
jgi:hypothetical protein